MALIVLTDSIPYIKARIAAMGTKPEDSRIVYVTDFNSYLMATRLDVDTPWYSAYGAKDKLPFDIVHGMHARFGEPHKNLSAFLDLLKAKFTLVQGGLS